nr:hypothetical protein [Paracoccus haematequi]
MEIDRDKIDDAVLALLWLTLHDERRAWKGIDWECFGAVARPGSDRRSGQQGKIGYPDR